MASTLKPLTKLIALIALLFIVTACASSTSTEIVAELPPKTQHAETSTIIATTKPTATHTPIDTLTATVTHTSAPTQTPTYTTEPPSLPTLEPTPRRILESPFTAEQLGGRPNFPVYSNEARLYTVIVFQSEVIPVDENTQLSGPFDYIHPSNIGIGWVLTVDGPQAIAFLNTYQLPTRMVTDPPEAYSNFVLDAPRTTYVYGVKINAFSSHIQDAAYQLFMLEQDYYLHHYEVVDPLTNELIVEYDDWEATDWDRTNPDLFRPRSGFGDVWHLSVIFPDHPIVQRILAEVDNSLHPDDEIGGWYSMWEHHTYTMASPDMGLVWPVGIVAPQLNDELSTVEVQGMHDFLRTGDPSGLPQIEIDGLTLPFLPAYRNHWFTDLAADDYVE